MPQTSTYGFRYPADNFAPNIPQYFQELAQDVEDTIAGSTGTFTLASGYSTGASYYAPSWRLGPDGQVMLRGMIARTGATTTIDVGTLYTVGTVPAAIRPTATVSPMTWFLTGAGAGATYPCRIFVSGGTGNGNLQISSMDVSGSRTLNQNIGLINLDGIGWYI